MLARALRWWKDPEGRRDENSNSFAMFVVMLPLILGSFGIGVDMSRNLYVRTAIRNHLDLAVVGGAGTHVASGKTIDTAAALVEVERVYAMNRAQGPGLRCTGTGKIVAKTSIPRCWTQPKAPSITSTSVTYTVREQSTNAFLQVLGIPLQTYTVSAKAKVNQTTQ